ncbi:MAG: hypothetical protein PGN11_20795 [Quadrisphaera sp.]
MLTITAEEGAAPLLALATRPDPETVDGAYLDRFAPRPAEPAGRRRRAGARPVGAVGGDGRRPRLTAGRGQPDMISTC